RIAPIRVDFEKWRARLRLATLHKPGTAGLVLVMVFPNCAAAYMSRDMRKRWSRAPGAGFFLRGPPGKRLELCTYRLVCSCGDVCNLSCWCELVKLRIVKF